MTSRPDKVQAGMDTLVDLFSTVGLLLLAHVALMLVINKVNDGHPRVLVVDIVAKAGGVDDSELDLEVLFFQLGLDDVNLGGLVELLCMALAVVLGGGKLGSEKGVDEGRLAERRNYFRA